MLVADESLLQDLGELEQRTFEAVNQLRLEHGLLPLESSSALSALAREHSEDMAKQDYFDHVTPSGLGYGERLAPRAGPFLSLAENIHRNRGTADPVGTAVAGWAASPGHRKNMLNADFDETGIGVAADDQGVFYLTQVFVERPAEGRNKDQTSAREP